jgi:hypothetical protein
MSFGVFLVNNYVPCAFLALAGMLVRMDHRAHIPSALPLLPLLT